MPSYRFETLYEKDAQAGGGRNVDIEAPDIVTATADFFELIKGERIRFVKITTFTYETVPNGSEDETPEST